MIQFYSIGTDRIVYKSVDFKTGKNVTVYVWDPDLNKSGLKTLTEIEDGLYYIDYTFHEEGVYIGLFHEDGVPTITSTFRVITPTIKLQQEEEDRPLRIKLVV